jgi:uncharacterized membrane-anchored protein
VRIVIHVLLSLIVFLSFSVQAFDIKYPETEDALVEAFLELSYEEIPAKYNFTNANQSYDLPEGWILFHGEEARRFLFYNNGVDALPDINALAVSNDFKYQLAFSYYEEGYIDDSDWERLNSDDLMEAIIETTAEDNIARIANGVSEFNIIGWEEEPSYDRKKEVAHYVIKGKDSSGLWLNSVAFRLGREGFTRIVLIGPSDNPQESSDTLTAALDNHSFDNGFLYSDFEPGDKMAGIGLASLVALTAGSKNGKGIAAGLIATLLFFAKKLWFVIFIPFIFLWGKIKRFFTNDG